MSFNFQDSEVYPVEASASGKNATHVNGCTIVGQSVPYAVCLKRIREYVNGKVAEENRECSRAIGGPACQAWVMMQEESAAGRALHFINRDKLREYVGIIASDLPQAPVSDVRSKPANPLVERTKRSPERTAAFSTPSYADVINQEIRESAKQSSLAEMLTPAPVVNNAPTRPPMNPGETPLEYSRRLRTLMQQEQAQ